MSGNLPEHEELSPPARQLTRIERAGLAAVSLVSGCVDVSYLVPKFYSSLAAHLGTVPMAMVSFGAGWAAVAGRLPSRSDKLTETAKPEPTSQKTATINCLTAQERMERIAALSEQGLVCVTEAVLLKFVNPTPNEG